MFSIPVSLLFISKLKYCHKMVPKGETLMHRSRNLKMGLKLSSAACNKAMNKSKCLNRHSICGRLPDLGVRGLKDENIWCINCKQTRTDKEWALLGNSAPCNKDITGKRSKPLRHFKYSLIIPQGSFSVPLSPYPVQITLCSHLPCRLFITDSCHHSSSGTFIDTADLAEKSPNRPAWNIQHSLLLWGWEKQTAI